MIDLFSGIGGIRLAFEQHGVECVASSEIDKYARITYFQNFSDIPLGDISMITSEDLPSFDILAGGFPCQPFSMGGLRKGFEDTRGTLFFQVARLLKSCQPKAFFLENVQGLVNHDKGKTLGVIEETLREVGYDFQWKVMDSCHYGVPQSRKRWYCIGFRKDLKIHFNSTTGPNGIMFHFPEPFDLRYRLCDILQSDVGDEYKVSDMAMNHIKKHLFEKQLLLPIVIDNMLAYEIRPSRCAFRYDGISPCLTAKMGTGGNNVPVLVKEQRKLTERECLRIMGYPDSFSIAKNSSHSYKQIGNSVVVPVVSLLAKEIVNVLNQI